MTLETDAVPSLAVVPLPTRAEDYLARHHPNVLSLCRKNLTAAQADKMLKRRSGLLIFFKRLTFGALAVYTGFTWLMFALQPNVPLPVFATLYGCIIIGAPYVYFAPYFARTVQLLQLVDLEAAGEEGQHLLTSNEQVLGEWRAYVLSRRGAYRMYDLAVMQAQQYARYETVFKRSEI